MSREAQDAFAAQSQQHFAAASDAGWFTDEIVAVAVKGRKGTESFAIDEAPRPDTTIEALARLKSAFRPDGTITAGNAPGLNSAAAALIVATRGFSDAKSRGAHGPSCRLWCCCGRARLLQPWSRSGCSQSSSTKSYAGPVFALALQKRSGRLRPQCRRSMRPSPRDPTHGSSPLLPLLAYGCCEKARASSMAQHDMRCLPNLAATHSAIGTPEDAPEKIDAREGAAQ
ncbi:hypothetical protein OSH12_25865 [Kaistia terrae]|uniref:thiolase family protein n=1 Tax=Kaistia terrae TaxID=537017 RepID=UPI002253ED46|nr:hypothetical protein [Kaistia terrae]MCX5581726.1 hypothetical protein [Kaistia terrae]